MHIGGFQKLTLLDFPGQVACILFTAGCNFCCPFCHNAGLVVHAPAVPVPTEAEIFAYLEKRRGLLDGVVSQRRRTAPPGRPCPLPAKN
jgi:pyruvate formate lyase activating enzyme